MEKAGLSEVVAKKVIEELVEAQRKKKKSKDKQFIKLKLSPSVLKKGFVNAILLKETGQADLKKLQVNNGEVYVPETDTYHMAQGNHIWYYKKFPFMIIPVWSVSPIHKEQEPFNLKELTEKSDREGTNTYAQRFIIKKAEEVAAGIKPKKAMGNPKVIIYIIAGVVVIYLISALLGKPIF